MAEYMDPWIVVKCRQGVQCTLSTGNICLERNHGTDNTDKISALWLVMQV